MNTTERMTAIKTALRPFAGVANFDIEALQKAVQHVVPDADMDEIAEAFDHLAQEMSAEASELRAVVEAREVGREPRLLIPLAQLEATITGIEATLSSLTVPQLKAELRSIADSMPGSSWQACSPSSIVSELIEHELVLRGAGSPPKFPIDPSGEFPF